jgi:hypothetical protein
MNLSAAIANSLWTASNVSALIQFRRALNHPAEMQLQLLRDYLARNADSAYGKAHDFGGIHSYEEFARCVPLADYEDIEPWIERIRRGESNVLTSDVVTHLIPTSGSTGARKLIPFTVGLQSEFNRAISPWIASLYSRHPSVALGTAYWSISPAFQIQDAEPSVVPIGFEDDSSYLGGTKKRLVDSVMAVPSELRLVSDMEQFRYLTLLCLLRQLDLRLISIWHPSFLSLLLDALPACWESLLQDIERGDCRHSDLQSPTVFQALNLRPMPGRARQLRNADPTKPETLWPNLKIISCWGDGHAQFAKVELERRFPSVFIQSKGLLATECVVTIPFSGSCPLAINSHFFEFIDEEGRICLAQELKENEIYEVVVTTGGGFWRYRLQDQVEVTGFVGKTPSLRFLGRVGNVSDRFGEKLSEHFVAQAIQEAIGAISSTQFVMLAPDEDHSGCRYTLYIEGDVTNEIAARLDTSLCRNPHYTWCRKTGQIQPLRLFRIKTAGYKTFVAREQSSGKRLGEIKPCSISKMNGWSHHFQGEYLCH